MHSRRNLSCFEVVWTTQLLTTSKWRRLRSFWPTSLDRDSWDFLICCVSKCDFKIKVWYKQTVLHHSRRNLSCFEVISTTQLMTTSKWRRLRSFFPTSLDRDSWDFLICFVSKCDFRIKVWYKQTVRHHSRRNLSCFKVISTTQLMTTYILLDYSWFEVILSVQNGVQKNESFWETAYSAKIKGFRGVWPFWKRLTFQRSKTVPTTPKWLKITIRA